MSDVTNAKLADPGEVEMACLERSGDISVIPPGTRERNSPPPPCSTTLPPYNTTAVPKMAGI
jgi:uncharacterized membrane protein YcaP (DUF421 family)